MFCLYFLGGINLSSHNTPFHYLLLPLYCVSGMNSSSSSSSRNRGRQQRGGADEVKKKVLSSILGEEAVKNLSKKQLKWIIIGVVAIFTILWYTTPLATVISGMIVNSIVPRYLDVQLGQSGKAYSRYTLSNDFNARNRVSRIGSTIISRLPSHMVSLSLG